MAIPVDYIGHGSETIQAETQALKEAAAPSNFAHYPVVGTQDTRVSVPGTDGSAPGTSSGGSSASQPTNLPTQFTAQQWNLLQGDVNTVISDIGASESFSGITNDLQTRLESSGQFTADEIQQIIGSFSTLAPGSQTISLKHDKNYSADAATTFNNWFGSISTGLLSWFGSNNATNVANTPAPAPSPSTTGGGGGGTTTTTGSPDPFLESLLGGLTAPVSTGDVQEPQPFEVPQYANPSSGNPLGLVVALGAAGFGVWWWYKKHHGGSAHHEGGGE